MAQTGSPRREGGFLVFDITTTKPVPGLWCPGCLLPSGIEFEIHSMCDEHGSHLFGTARICVDCRQPIPKEATA